MLELRLLRRLLLGLLGPALLWSYRRDGRSGHRRCSRSGLTGTREKPRVRLLVLRSSRLAKALLLGYRGHARPVLSCLCQLSWLWLTGHATGGTLCRLWRLTLTRSSSERRRGPRSKSVLRPKARELGGLWPSGSSVTRRRKLHWCSSIRRLRCRGQAVHVRRAVRNELIALRRR